MRYLVDKVFRISSILTLKLIQSKNFNHRIFIFAINKHITIFKKINIDFYIIFTYLHRIAKITNIYVVLSINTRIHKGIETTRFRYFISDRNVIVYSYLYTSYRYNYLLLRKSIRLRFVVA